MRFDLAHTFVAVFQQAFVEFRVQTARACLKRDLIFERADFAFAAGLVADVDGRFGAAGAFYGAGDAAKRVEVTPSSTLSRF